VPAVGHARVRRCRDGSQAVDLALASKLVVITGGPGVGKKTIMRTILAILAAKEVRILLAAPTGRAAKRMSPKVHQ